MKLVNKAKSTSSITPIVGDYHQSNVEIDIVTKKLQGTTPKKFKPSIIDDFAVDELLIPAAVIGFFGGLVGLPTFLDIATSAPDGLVALSAIGGAIAGPFVLGLGPPTALALLSNGIRYPFHLATSTTKLGQHKSLLLDLLCNPKFVTNDRGETKQYLAEAVLNKFAITDIINLSPEIRSELLNQPWAKSYLNTWFNAIDTLDTNKNLNIKQKISVLFDIAMKSDDPSLKLSVSETALTIYGYNKDTKAMLDNLIGDRILDKTQFDLLNESVKKYTKDNKRKDGLQSQEKFYRDFYQAESIAPVVTKDIEIIEPSRALSTAEQIEQVRANLMSAETARQAVDNAIQSGNSLSLIDLGDDLFKAVTRVLSSINQDSVATLTSARVSMADLMRIPAEAKARQEQLERMLDDSFIGKLRNKFTPKSRTSGNEKQADFTEIDARLAQAQATARNFIEKNEVLGKYGAELISPLQHLQQAIQERLSSSNAKDLTDKQFDLLKGTCSHTEQLINVANTQIGLTSILDNGETKFYQFLRQLSLTNATAGIRETISVNEQKEKMRETLSASMVEITREDIRALQEKVTALETAFNKRSTELDEGNHQLKELGREIRALERPSEQLIEIEIPIMLELARG